MNENAAPAGKQRAAHREEQSMDMIQGLTDDELRPRPGEAGGEDWCPTPEQIRELLGLDRIAAAVTARYPGEDRRPWREDRELRARWGSWADMEELTHLAASRLAKQQADELMAQGHVMVAVYGLSWRLLEPAALAAWSGAA